MLGNYAGSCFIMRAFGERDKPAIIRHLNNYNIASCLLKTPYPYTEADAEEWFRTLSVPSGVMEAYAIDMQGECQGAIGISDIVPGHKAEIGYWLAEEQWRKGIMSEVLQVACDYAFAKYELVRLEAHTFAFNTPSAKLLEKLGFVYEGTLRKDALRMGKFIDRLAYARIKE